MPRSADGSLPRRCFALHQGPTTQQLGHCPLRTVSGWKDVPTLRDEKKSSRRWVTFGLGPLLSKPSSSSSDRRSAT